jgi:hypothetical protein
MRACSHAELRRKFTEFDRDGNGYVTMDEAHEILQRQLGFSPVQSINLVRKYDKNGDGQLNYDEFVLFYAKVKAKSVKCYKLIYFMIVTLYRLSLCVCPFDCLSVFLRVISFVKVSAHNSKGLIFRKSTFILYNSSLTSARNIASRRGWTPCE